MPVLYCFVLGAAGGCEKSGEIIVEGMQAKICDPRYNTGCIAGPSNSEKYDLSRQGMNQFVQLPLAVMDLGGPKHLFCSVLQV